MEATEWKGQTSLTTELCSNLDQNKHATRPKIESPNPPKNYEIAETPMEQVGDALGLSA